MMRGAPHRSMIPLQGSGWQLVVSWWLALRNLAQKILGVEDRCVGNLDKSSAAYVDSHATFRSATPGSCLLLL